MIAALVAIVAVAVVPFVPTMVVATITVALLVMGNVFVLVPGVLHKVDPLAAGIVLAAVLAPVFRVARGHVQVNRLALYGCLVHDSRLLIDHLWLRIAADVDAPIEARLTDTDGNSDIGRECREGDGSECRCE